MDGLGKECSTASMDSGWRLKKRLTLPLPAPKRKQAKASAHQAVLQLEGDDPMMERAHATEGGAAPLSTSSSDDEKLMPIMEHITPSAHDVAEKVGQAVAKEASPAEVTEAFAEAKVTEETAKEEDLLAHEPPLASPHTPSDGEPSDEEEPNDELPSEADSTEHVYDSDTPDEMGHDE